MEFNIRTGDECPKVSSMQSLDFGDYLSVDYFFRGRCLNEGKRKQCPLSRHIILNSNSQNVLHESFGKIINYAPLLNERESGIILFFLCLICIREEFL